MQSSPAYRITSIDILRGIVMIIMALDHTRDFFHQPAMTSDPLDDATTTIWIYFTRWITHFCAPTFVFLSGISAWLSSQRKTRSETSNFLLKRGLWLILVEIAIVSLGITFNPLYNFIILQVIWAIGVSMVILALLIRISNAAIFFTGVILFFGHNLLDHIPLGTSSFSGVIDLLVTTRGNVIPVGDTHFIGFFYAAIPWTGVMLMGYSVGFLFSKNFPPARRRQLLIIGGLTCIILFLMLRTFNLYGNPEIWVKDESPLRSLMRYLNVSKYPPSLMYCFMTLGPSLLVLAFTENINNRFTRFVSIYGKVPFFYYILHFYLLHLILVVVFFTHYDASRIITPQSPFLFRPNEFGYPLPIVYLIWLSAVLLLYFPCRWYNRYKFTRTHWWLSYL